MISEVDVELVKTFKIITEGKDVVIRRIDGEWNIADEDDFEKIFNIRGRIYFTTQLSIALLAALLEQELNKKEK